MNVELNRLFQPSAGSRAQFRARLDAAIAREKREAAVLKAATGVLVLVIGFLIFSPPRDFGSIAEARELLDTKPAPRKTEVSDGAVVDPHSNDGVRLYWLMR